MECRPAATMTDISLSSSSGGSCLEPKAIDRDALVPWLGACQREASGDGNDQLLCFADAFGNRLDFSHTAKSVWYRYVLSLIVLEQDGFVEIPGDGGRLFYVLRRRDPGLYVLSELRLDLYGKIGMFVSQVYLHDLSVFKQFIEKLPDDGVVSDDPDAIPPEAYEQMFVSD